MVQFLVDLISVEQARGMLLFSLIGMVLWGVYVALLSLQEWVYEEVNASLPE